MSFAFAILFFLPPYALAVAMPSWRWLLAYIAVVGGLLGVWFTAMATSQPRYGEEAIGFLFLLPIAVSFGAGTLIRTASLIMAACGRSRASVFATNLLGFSIPLGIFGATIGWLEWETRSPSEACSRATFHIELAGERLAIPAAPIFSIQIGPDRKQGTYNFSIPAKLRDFCGLTDDGRRPIRAVRINIGFGVGARWSNPKFCSASPAAWETQLCSAIEAGKRDWTYEADFPFYAAIVSPGELSADEFGGSAFTYYEALTRSTPGNGGVFVRSASQTPDGHALTFACRGSAGWKHQCDTSYPWRDGIHLFYQFNTMDAGLADKGDRVDATLKAFLEQLHTGT